MQIRDVMTREVRTIARSATIRDAARIMADLDIGILPVAEEERLVGMISDRDIALRGVGAGKGPDAAVSDVMSPEVKYCYEDEEIETVCRNLAEIQVRRLPVLNRNKQLVGIVSLADLVGNDAAEACGRAIEGITRKGGRHNQSVELTS
jgi:CBS domain-containing protein